MLEQLFKNLAIRLKNENDLSDITWTFCITFPEFKNLFLRFLFGDGDYCQCNIIREVASDDSRPDFVIYVDNKPVYVIEVKIYDKKHHFGQYKGNGAFEGSKFGYIANYPIPHNETYKIKRWDEFYHYLSTHKNDEYINAYCVYLRSVCGIQNFQKMKLKNLESIDYFNIALRKLLLNSNSKDLYINPVKDEFLAYRSGVFFSLKFLQNNICCEGWIGVYYGNATDPARVSIEFKNHEKVIFDNIKSGQTLVQRIEDSEHYCWVYDMFETVFEKFNEETTSKEEQFEILKSYMDEVLSCICIK